MVAITTSQYIDFKGILLMNLLLLTKLNVPMAPQPYGRAPLAEEQLLKQEPVGDIQIQTIARPSPINVSGGDEHPCWLFMSLSDATATAIAAPSIND